MRSFLLALALLMAAGASCGPCAKREAPRNTLPDSARDLQVQAAATRTGAVDSGTDSSAADAALDGAATGDVLEIDPPHLPRRGGGSFFSDGDGDIRRRLATLDFESVKRGYGGRSVAFRIKLTDGTEGYYKPEQTFSAAHWHSEVAAYHLDRMLGLNRVPPVVSRRVEWNVLRRAAPSDERFAEVIVGNDGTVRGSFSHWVPYRLRPLRVGPGWEKWVRVEPWSGAQITPFARPRAYVEQLRARGGRSRARGNPDGGVVEGSAPVGTSVVVASPPVPAVVEATQEAVAAAPNAGVPNVASGDPSVEDASNAVQRAGDPDIADRPAELSDMILFDYLVNNTDRWGGENANVLVRMPGSELVFLDNAAGFGQGAYRTRLMDSRLHVLQKFRRRTVAAIRALDVRAFVRRMEDEPLAPILEPSHVAGFNARRSALLTHIAELERQFGDAVFPW